MNRRAILAAGAALGMPAIARAQDFTGPVRLVVPFPPGGTSDILARLIGPPLSQAIGQSVVVENRPGAGGNVGADAVAKSRPDGHTLLLLDISALAIYPSLLPRMPFDVERDLAPVTVVVYAPYILAVNNQLPVRNAQELAAFAKANPGKLNFANSGTGTLSHIVALSLASHWGGEATSVPYRGGAPALMSLVTNEANVTMAGATQSMPFVVQGQMRGIAVSGPRRFPNLPDLPTFRELGWPEPDSGTWQGIMTQGNTPPAMIARLEREIKAVLAQPAVVARIGELGGEVRAEGSAAMRELLRAQTEAYGRIIRANNITAEQ